MGTKVTIPVKGWLESAIGIKSKTGIQVAVAFPPRCAFCNGPAETTVMVDVSGGKDRNKRSVTFSTQFAIPYCLDHAIVNHQYNKLITRIGIVLFLVVFVAWFFAWKPFSNFVEQFPGINLIFLPLIFPCIGNAIVGFFAVLLLHGILLLANPAFRQIPFFSSNGSLGVKINMKAEMWGVQEMVFDFYNADYAAEFSRMNPPEPAPAPAV